MRTRGNKKLLIFSVLLMVLAVGMSVISAFTAPAGTAGEKTITVEVVHKDGTEAEFSYTTDKEFLGELLLEEGLISGDQGQYGLFITTVDGETADFAVDSGWWQLLSDGEKTTVGIDSQPITDGAVYTLAYTIGS